MRLKKGDKEKGKERKKTFEDLEDERPSRVPVPNESDKVACVLNWYVPCLLALLTKTCTGLRYAGYLIRRGMPFVSAVAALLGGPRE